MPQHWVITGCRGQLGHALGERLREAGKLTAVRMKPSADAAGAVARCRGSVAASASGPAAR